MELNPKQKVRLAQMPESMHGTYLKAIGASPGKPKPSKAYAIHAFCDECVGYSRRAVRECTSTGCPLWALRPYQGKS